MYFCSYLPWLGSCAQAARDIVLLAASLEVAFERGVSLCRRQIYLNELATISLTILHLAIIDGAALREVYFVRASPEL